MTEMTAKGQKPDPSWPGRPLFSAREPARPALFTALRSGWGGGWSPVHFLLGQPVILGLKHLDLVIKQHSVVKLCWIELAVASLRYRRLKYCQMYP